MASRPMKKSFRPMHSALGRLRSSKSSAKTLVFPRSSDTDSDSSAQHLKSKALLHRSAGRLPLLDLDVLEAKLRDIETPGYVGELDPDEAEYAGAFREDALSEDDALCSCEDVLGLVFEEAP